MAKEFAKAFYNSTKWQKCRNAYIKHRQSIDGGLCESCHKNMGYIVHHKEELTPENIHDPDVALNFSNLKYDCHVCHNKEREGKDTVPGAVRYKFTEDGDVIPLPP